MKSRRATPQLTLPFGPTLAPAANREPTSDRAPLDPSPLSFREPAFREPAQKVGREAPRAARRASPIREHRLASELRVLVGGQLRLHVHDNRSTMVSFRREQETLHLRVHHMFLDAGPEVVRALADYARARSARAGRVLDQFVRQNREAIKTPVDEGTRPLRTDGAVYDLQELYDSINRAYFGGEVKARIGWGRGAPNRRRRSIRMGAYYHDTQTILIHPALDREDVPRYFVELVVYHEMLHQAVPQERADSGRRAVHSPEFRAREREFEEYERARVWEHRNLGMLLRPTRRAG